MARCNLTALTAENAENAGTPRARCLIRKTQKLNLFCTAHPNGSAMLPRFPRFPRLIISAYSTGRILQPAPINAKRPSQRVISHAHRNRVCASRHLAQLLRRGRSTELACARPPRQQVPRYGLNTRSARTRDRLYDVVLASACFANRQRHVASLIGLQVITDLRARGRVRCCEKFVSIRFVRVALLKPSNIAHG